jgi:hypothetical protein
MFRCAVNYQYATMHCDELMVCALKKKNRRLSTNFFQNVIFTS